MKVRNRYRRIAMRRPKFSLKTLVWPHGGHECILWWHPPIHQPGEYDLELMGLTNAVRAKKRTMQEDPVRSKLQIVAKSGERP
jgi:hypothetical protein